MVDQRPFDLQPAERRGSLGTSERGSGDPAAEVLHHRHGLPRTLPGLEPDGRRVLTSDEAFGMTELPRSMIILGGGVIGVEWASLLQDFGVEVTIIEAEDRLVPAEDAEISQALALRSELAAASRS